jgi:CBS domain-containing protein
MRISELCTRAVVTCPRDASGLDVAQKMREQHVGDVVVVDERGPALRPLGVITDRDLVIEVMARGVDPSSLRAEDLITGTVVTALASELVHDAVWHMRANGLRRLPVVDDTGRLVGMLTADDVARHLAQDLVDLVRVAPLQIDAERTRRAEIGAQRVAS